MPSIVLLIQGGLRMARLRFFTLILLVAILFSALPLAAQGGPGTEDFPIRNFAACINLPDFTVTTQPDIFNTLYTVPGLFEINFAEYLLPLSSLPNSSGEIYNAMIALLNTVSAGEYVRVTFNHPQYISAAVEFTLDGRRMFGMIYRNQNDTVFFLFADKVAGFDMLAIGRAIFAADSSCTGIPGIVNPAPETVTSQPAAPAAQPQTPAQPAASSFTCSCSKTCGQMASCEEAYFQLNQCGCGRRDGDNDGVPCESICPGG